jgi:hypothetical protein
MVFFISSLMVLRWVHHLVHCLLTSGLSYHEKSWFSDCPSNFKPLFFRRYVDDCFLILQSRDHVLPFRVWIHAGSYPCRFIFNRHTCAINLFIQSESSKLTKMISYINRVNECDKCWDVNYFTSPGIL